MLKIAGITLLALMLLAFIIPVVFKKQVQALVKKEINKTLDAKVDFTDVKLSLFRHFPKATITIKGLSIAGKDVFTNDTLIAADKIDITAGIFSLLKGKNIKVSGLYLQSPRIHVLVNKDGRANWDIAKKRLDTAGAADTSASNFKITLKKYTINDGYLIYDDKQANTYTELKGLEHAGSGNLTADVFTLSTSTHAASAYFVVDDIPYLLNTKTDIATDIKIDNRTNTYTFKTDDIVLNNLKLSADGFVQMVNNSTFNMDFRFKSPSNDFRDILSMVPAVYKKDFASIKTNGKAVFNGFVKGTYTPEQMPAYDVNLEVKDGSFQYPDLPKPVKNIQLLLNASNSDGKRDHAIVNISKGHLEMDNEPFDFRFIYKNPVTTQFIDAAAKGKVDLSQLSKFIKLENGTKLSGFVWADAFVKGPLKAIEQHSGAFTAGGFFDIRNLYYSANNFPQPIQNGNIKATLENNGGIADMTVVNISSGHLELGN
ncbi:MAG TPA: AsmA family protein, partial [Chitinophagaceae bacterium]